MIINRKRQNDASFFKQITIAGTGAEVNVDEGKTSSKFTVSPSYKIGDLKIGGEYKGTTSLIPFLGAGTETPTHSIKGTAHYSFGGSGRSWTPKTSFSGLITTKAGIESHKETTTTEYPYDLEVQPWRGEDETFSRSTEKIITTPTASARATLGVSKGEEKSCMVGDYFCGGGYSGFHLGAFGEVSTNKPAKFGLSGHIGALSGEVSYTPETKSFGGGIKLSVPLSAIFGGNR